uniref:Putative Apetala1-like MADS-box transcription factor n=1 Tax=Crocus sativus TaxID=82528 RepID=Q7XAT7_CROSA|nr:putative Apetala1-like MADS-box transcription factor [Crocus sativus]
MGRGRVELKRIENTINRQVTFSKRRGGLLKKANEISVLCDADVAIIIFSTKGKLSEYSTDARMESILERYDRYSCAERDIVAPDPDSQESWRDEYGRLKAKLEALQTSQRHLMGAQLDMLSAKELQQLEQQLENALKNIRSRKNQLLFDSISELLKKEKTLTTQNKDMEMKLIEKKKVKSMARQGQQYTESSSPPSLLIQDPFPSLTIGINPASGSSEEDNEARLLPPVNRNRLPPWMVRSANE